MDVTAGISMKELAPAFGDVIYGEGGGLLDLDRDWLIDRYRRRGCLVFRGFGATTAEFEQLSDSLGRDFMNYQGGGLRFGQLDREAVNPQRTVMTASGKTQEFPVPMHGELYYMAHPPEMIWFYCARTAVAGGETLIADAHAAWEALSPATQRLLREHPIQYLRALNDGDWQVAFLTDDRGEVERCCRENKTEVMWMPNGSLRTRYQCLAFVIHPHRGTLFINTILPVACGEIAIRQGLIPGMEALKAVDQLPLVVRLDDETPFPAEVIEEMETATKRLAARVQWEVGDLLVADNTWILHGRRSSPSTDRVVYARMCACNFVREV
jgi:alpha-ketoglutarate-dependent taurine dioxygenase